MVRVGAGGDVGATVAEQCGQCASAMCVQLGGGLLGKRRLYATELRPGAGRRCQCPGIVGLVSLRPGSAMQACIGQA